MRRMSGFSLMEMMVVLLIVAIVMAASAPMISKRMIRTAENSSPWLYAGMSGNNIFYNGNGDNSTAMIGTTTVPDSQPRLVIDAGEDTDIPALSIFRGGTHIANLIARENTVGFAKLTDDSESTQDYSVYLGTNQTINTNNPNGDPMVTYGHSVAIGDNVTVGDNSIAIGSCTKIGKPSNSSSVATGSIAIGTTKKKDIYNTTILGAEVYSSDSIAIGRSAQIGGKSDSSSSISTDSIAIGTNALVGNSLPNSIAIGSGAKVIGSTGSGSIAIGTSAEAQNQYSIAIGYNTKATKKNSIAIGNNITNDKVDVIQLGSSSQTVYIPGNLVVGGGVVICDKNSGLYLNIDGTRAWGDKGGYRLINTLTKTYSSDRYIPGFSDGNNTVSLPTWANNVVSDRRLKNVGEMFAGGLEQVKKLEVYNYTFKKDSANTPRVGVMAQDLQKIFPNAVIKGEDGYLRIRMEDMFYAVVNAVKELDNKLTAIAEQLKAIADDMNILKNKNAEYEKTITELAEQNKVLMKKNAEFEERLAKLEGKAIKKETKEMTKAVKQESKLSKQEEKARLKAQKQAEKEAKKGVKKG